jgi:adenylylsulfate kinase
LNERWKRSLVKAITYRLIIIVLDLTAIYLFTGRLDIALGFMIISNVYTSVAYYSHERIWNKIGWGKTENKEQKNLE